MTNLIDNKGDKLFVTLYPNPEKETIVLLHGGPGFPGNLTEVANFLKESFQIITFHQRGTKKSPCPGRDYSMTSYMSDIEAIRQYYKIYKFHLWGHSWGGLYAQIYAEKYSGNLLSLFLCSPGSGTNSEWKQTQKEALQINKSKCTSWEWTKMGLNNLLGILGSDNAYKRLFKQVMINYNDGFIKEGSIKLSDENDFDNLKAEPINQTMLEIGKYPLLKPVTSSYFKITIVYGDQDIYKSSKEFVINRYPSAKVFTIKDCGHLPWLHNPVDYKIILKQHYQNLPGH